MYVTPSAFSVRPEAPLPEAVSQDRHGLRRGGVVLGSEQPTDLGGDAENPEKLARRAGRADLFRLSGAREADRRRHHDADVLEL